MQMTLYFVFFLGNTSSFLYTTRRGKFLEWDRILDRLHLRGDEVVLDMGCGRGAVLTAVARRLTTGRVTGVDIWSKKDQSGNASDVTLRNASLEGVAGRVQIETGDMRALPHPDATFDLVVSSLAIHNIRSNADRKRAIVEGFRVLKPGGRIVIADIRATAIYEEALRALERRMWNTAGWGGDSGGATRSPARPSLALQERRPKNCHDDHLEAEVSACFGREWACSDRSRQDRRTSRLPAHVNTVSGCQRVSRS